jgi:hypothetical protein
MHVLATTGRLLGEVHLDFEPAREPSNQLQEFKNFALINVVRTTADDDVENLIGCR